MRRLAALLALALMTSGCAERFDAARLGVPATLSEPAGQTLEGGQPFRVTSRSLHLFWGLIPASRSSLERALAGQLIDSPQIHSVKIHVRSRWSDLLISALTLGVVVPRAVTYEGVVAPRQPD
jgi:hypothetical protein